MMQKNKKKLVSWLLSLTMVLTLLPLTPARAAGDDGEIHVSYTSANSGSNWNWTPDESGGGTLNLNNFHGRSIYITANGGDVHVKLRGENTVQASVRQLQKMKPGFDEAVFYHKIEEIGLKVIDGNTVHLAVADEDSSGSLAITCSEDPGGLDIGIVAGICAQVSTDSAMDNGPQCSVYVDRGAHVSVLVDSHWKSTQNNNHCGNIGYYGLLTDTVRARPIYSVGTGGRLDITINTVEQDTLSGRPGPTDQQVTLIQGYSGSSGQLGHVYGEMHLTYGGPDVKISSGRNPYRYTLGPVTVFEGAYVELHSTQADQLDTVDLSSGLFINSSYKLNVLIRECTAPEYHMNGELPETVWQKEYSDVAVWADGKGDGYSVTAKNAIIYPVTIPNRPRNVELLYNGDNRVELKPVEAPLYGSMEYGVLDRDAYVDSGSQPSVWQDSPVFPGLTAGHDYKFFARLKPVEGRYLTPRNGTLESAGYITVKGPTQTCTLTNAEFDNYGYEAHPKNYLVGENKVVVGESVCLNPTYPDRRYQFVDWTVTPEGLHYEKAYEEDYMQQILFIMPNEPVTFTANFTMAPLTVGGTNCTFFGTDGGPHPQYQNCWLVPVGGTVTATPVIPESTKPGQHWSFQDWSVTMNNQPMDFTDNGDGTITFIVPEAPEDAPYAQVSVKANYTEIIDDLTEITVRCDSAVLRDKPFDGAYLNIPTGELFINGQPWNNLTDQRIKDHVTAVWRDPETKEPVPVCPGDGITAGSVLLGPVAEGSYEFAVLLDGVDKFTKTVSITAPAAFSIDETMDYGGTKEFDGLKWSVPLQAVICGGQRLWDEAAGSYAPEPLRMTLIARWFDAEGNEIPMQRKYSFEGLSGPSTAGTFRAELWYVPELAALEYLPESIDFTAGRKVCDLQKTFTTTPDRYVKLTTSDDWYPTQQYGKLRLYATVGRVGDQLYLMSGEPDGNRMKAVSIPPEADGSLLLGDTSAFLVWPLNEYKKVGDGEKVAGLDYVPFHWRLSNATRNNMTLWLSRMGFERVTGDDQHTIALDPNEDYALHWDCFIDGSTMCFGRDATDGQLYFFGYNYNTPQEQYSQLYPVYFYWNKDEWVDPQPPLPENNEYGLLKALDKVFDGQPVTVDPMKELLINKGQTSWAEAEKYSGAFVEWQDANGLPRSETAAENGLFIGPSEAGEYQFVIYERSGKPHEGPDGKLEEPDPVEKLRHSFAITPPKEPEKTCLLTVIQGSAIGFAPTEQAEGRRIYQITPEREVYLQAFTSEGMELEGWDSDDSMVKPNPTPTGWRLVMPDHDLVVTAKFREKPTEPPTEPPTEEPTEPPTEPSTEEPTEKPTEKPTEPPTEAPTEEPTEAPTEPKPTEPEKYENPFTDVKETDYYHQPIAWAADKGITQGVTEHTFGPELDCTREQIVTFLWREAGKPEPRSMRNPFADVKESDYSYQAILWAVENQITMGTSETTFSPRDACTRAQAVTFLWRAGGKPTMDKAKNPFTDLNRKEYYVDAVLWAVEKGVTVGADAYTFEPDSTCTRGQIVTFLYRNEFNNK